MAAIDNSPDDDIDEDQKQAMIQSYLANSRGNSSNQSADSSDPGDEEEENVSAAPDAAVAMVANPSDEDKQQAINDYIKKQYAAANDNSGIVAAQQAAQHNNYVANIGDALESFAKSNSMAHGGAGVDSGYYQGLKQQSQAGIQQAVANKQAAGQDLMQKTALDRNSGDSQISKNAVSSAQTTFADNPHIDDIIKEGMSANEVDDALKALEKKSTLDNTKSTKQMQLAYQQSALKDKKDLQQDKVYSEMNGKLTNPRGNQSVQQAQIGVASGRKAMDLINQYPDLNKMPSQQVSLLAQEISKVASGGVGSEHGQRSLEANTVQSGWNKLMSSVDGEPTGAQLKPFIEQNKTYLQNMMKTNQDTVNGYQQQVYNGYKKRLTPEQDMLFRTDNPHLFAQQQEASNNPVAGANALAQNSQPQTSPASVHPQANDALHWAQSNPNDPRSAEIFKRLGAQNAGL